MRKTLFALALLASALSIPLTAHADTIDQFSFNFVTPPIGFQTIITIDLPASPPPSYFGGFGECPPSSCISVLGTSGPNTYLVNFGQLSPTETIVGYAQYDNLSSPFPPARAFTQILAPNLFTGPIDAPTFLTGTFNAVLETDIPFLPPFPGTITIEPLTNSTVPEPSSFALMATGILGAITTLRHRKSMSRSRTS
jgi:hypothetical protein